MDKKVSVGTKIILGLALSIFLMDSSAWAAKRDYEGCKTAPIVKFIKKIAKPGSKEIGKITHAALERGKVEAEIACVAVVELACHAALDEETGPIGALGCIAGGFAFGETCKLAIDAGLKEKDQHKAEQVIADVLAENAEETAINLCKALRSDSILVENHLKQHTIKEVRAVLRGMPDVHAKPSSVIKPKGKGLIYPAGHKATVKVRVAKPGKKDQDLEISGVRPGEDIVVVYAGSGGGYHIEKK